MWTLYNSNCGCLFLLSGFHNRKDMNKRSKYMFNDISFGEHIAIMITVSAQYSESSKAD